MKRAQIGAVSMAAVVLFAPTSASSSAPRVRSSACGAVLPRLRGERPLASLPARRGTTIRCGSEGSSLSSSYNVCTVFLASKILPEVCRFSSFLWLLRALPRCEASMAGACLFGAPWARALGSAGAGGLHHALGNISLAHEQNSFR